MGGTLPQLGVESPVSAETEGEFGRERDPGCTSENGVSIIRLYFPVSGRNNASAKEGFAAGVPDVARGERLLTAGSTLSFSFFFFPFYRAFTLINEGQAPVGECLWVVSFMSG